MLDGKTIAITRSKDDASEFIDLAKQNNAVSDITAYNRTCQQRRENC